MDARYNFFMSSFPVYAKVSLHDCQRIVDAKRAGRKWLVEVEASAVNGPSSGPQSPSQQLDDKDDDWSPPEPSALEDSPNARPSFRGCKCDYSGPSLAEGLIYTTTRHRTQSGDWTPLLVLPRNDWKPASLMAVDGLIVAESCDEWMSEAPSLQDGLMVAVTMNAVKTNSDQWRI